MKPLSLLAAVALGLLLQACIKSEAPKFPLSSAVPALGDGGRYEVFERSSHVYSRLSSMEMRRRPDGAYDFVTEKDPIPMSFHDIGNGRFVVQATVDDPPGYGYGVMMREGSAILLYTTGCDLRDPAILESHGVDPDTCSIDNVKDPIQFFNVIFSADEPTFKLVPVQ